MMRNVGILPAAILVFLTLLSCNKQPAEKRQATVVLQDGSEVSGAVVSTSASEITLAGDDSITRTIPMSQVKSVQYAEAAPQPEASTETQPAAPAPAKKPVAPVRERRTQLSQREPVAETSAPPSRPAS